MLLLCALHLCTFRKTRRPSCLVKCYSDWNSISWTGRLVNKFDSFTGAQWYTGCSVMDYQSSNIVGDNLKNSSLSGLMEYASPKPGVHNQPITSSPKHYAGSSLVEYAILKAGGHIFIICVMIKEIFSTICIL